MHAIDVRRVTGYQDFVDTAPLDLILVADYSRMKLVPVAQRMAYACTCAGAMAQSIVVASTTSTEQSGLFSVLLPEFKKVSGIDVKVVALGTGQAIDMGRRGDADVLFVHDKVAEEKVDFVTVAEVVREGKALELRDLLFDLNESELRPESKTALQRIFQEIQAFNWTIEIGGHTDNTGTEKHNLKLSSQRAQKVRDYLVRQGYPAEKISAKGYGASVPIAGNDSEAGRALNRRVEIKIKE